MYKKISLLITPLAFSLFIAPTISANESQANEASPKPDADEQQPVIFEEVLITGGHEGVKKTAGSATFIDESAIEEMDFTDLNQLLTKVPGIYIRQEDGFGLRPNLGLRGTNSDRSSKITIMEDGILITPAPYSAPAAYYIPNVNRMAAVEVFKGPSVVEYGPHTVGGAINFVSQPVPANKGEAGITLGSFGHEKYSLNYGREKGQFGFVVDLLRFGSDGFKELDNGGDTGFIRNDANLKLQWQSDESAKIQQVLQLKLGFADEEADESYLGLSQEDFNENPNRRYIASQLDRFVSERTQVHLIHTLKLSDALSFTTKAYSQSFERSWNKFNGFFPESISIFDVLDEEAFGGDYLPLIRGERDSNALAAEGDQIDVTDNNREYQSSGLELKATLQQSNDSIENKINIGARFHNDWVERNHQPRGYNVVDQVLVFDGVERNVRNLNRAEADAIALYVNDTLVIGDLKLNFGIRYETVDTEFKEEAPGKITDISGSQSEIMPGLGVHYQLTENLGLIFGVNKGFSPKSASAGEDINPEIAINYESGFRFAKEALNIEAITFYSDYQELLGRCRASEACAGEEYNAGESEISGLEFTASYIFDLNSNLSFPIDLVYTYTNTHFSNDFPSGFSQWGNVKEGDFMPYVPKNQAHINIGVESAVWAANFAINYSDEMLETSGEEQPLSGFKTDALATVDFSSFYELNDRWVLRFIVNNVLDEQKIVSRRPFGARPNAPRLIKLGATYHF